MALTRREFLQLSVVAPAVVITSNIVLRKCGSGKMSPEQGMPKPEIVTELDKRGEFVFEELTKWFASEEFKAILEKNCIGQDTPQIEYDTPSDGVLIFEFTHKQGTGVTAKKFDPSLFSNDQIVEAMKEVISSHYRKQHNRCSIGDLDSLTV